MDGQLAAALRVASTTRDVRIAAGGLGAMPGVLRQAAPAARYLVIADDQTWKAAGRRTAALLAADDLAAADPIVLSGQPRVKASAETAQDLAKAIQSAAALPIAVGAGVINDLVKYAAELAGTPYVCVPTAASMDGYAASGAALREGGFKRTFACAAPVAIVADLDVIATAPKPMAGWGYGDLAGKLVAGADWILADALGVEALNPGPFAMVQDNLAGWLGEPAGVRRGEPAALDGLMRGLIIAGLAMQAHGNSRPASGSDHQFAHLWEMEEVAVGGLPVSHGACVGIGCLSMLAAYEWLLRQDVSLIDPAGLANRTPSAAALRADVTASFPLPFMAANAEVEVAAKVASPRVVAARLRRLQESWPRIAGWLRRNLPAAETVRRWLEAAGAPSSAATIGIADAKHAQDYRRARLIRRRFTGLDVLHELGWLDAMVSDLFATDGFWRKSRAFA
ncbi:MAG: sn-glycerol-1-phosphate dehydrogenase [Reyranella sp.]|uniref:sn-glycerol-1-phosphate dehydrogenase n=1 Tax=Reyranella sp. TaxID=1929291 RepID=UPI003D142978